MPDLNQTEIIVARHKHFRNYVDLTEKEKKAKAEKEQEEKKRAEQTDTKPRNEEEDITYEGTDTDL